MWDDHVPPTKEDLGKVNDEEDVKEDPEDPVPGEQIRRGEEEGQQKRVRVVESIKMVQKQEEKRRQTSVTRDVAESQSPYGNLDEHPMGPWRTSSRTSNVYSQL